MLFLLTPGGWRCVSTYRSFKIHNLGVPLLWGRSRYTLMVHLAFIISPHEGLGYGETATARGILWESKTFYFLFFSFVFDHYLVFLPVCVPVCPFVCLQPSLYLSIIYLSIKVRITTHSLPSCRLNEYDEEQIRKKCFVLLFCFACVCLRIVLQKMKTNKTKNCKPSLQPLTTFLQPMNLHQYNCHLRNCHSGSKKDICFIANFTCGQRL